MCLTATALLGIAQQGLSFMAEKEASEQQYQNYKNNAVTANQAATEQYVANNNKVIQEEAKAVQERLQNKINTAKAIGTAKASTQNQGISTNMVITDLERQGARADSVTDTNVKNAKAEAQATRLSIQQQTQNRINSVDTGTDPDLFAHAIAGIGTVYAATENKYEGKDHNGGYKKHG